MVVDFYLVIRCLSYAQTFFTALVEPCLEFQEPHIAIINQNSNPNSTRLQRSFPLGG